MVLRTRAKRFFSVVLGMVAAAMLCLIPSRGDAAQVRLTLTGTLDEIVAQDADDNDDTAAFRSILPFSLGDPVVAVVTYDTAAEDSDPRLGVGRYRTGNTLLTIGATTFDTMNLIDVINNAITPADSFTSGSFGGASPFFNAPGWDFVLGGSVVSLPHRVTLTDLTGTAFRSANLPTRSLDADDFDTLTWEIQTLVQPGGNPNTIVSPLGSHSAEFHRIAGAFTTLTLTVVPEPSAAWLGLLALGVGASALSQRG